MAASNRIPSRFDRGSIQDCRAIARTGIAVLACCMMICNAGCVTYLANFINVIRGNDNPAEFDELKEKKVAVVASTESGFDADASGILMSRHVHALLARNVKKVEMINSEEVDRIINDQPSGDRDMSVIGRRLGADYVILVDLENLRLRDGQTLYKGRCNATVTAYKVSEGERPVFRKILPEFVYPQSGAPVTDFDEATFQRVYLSELATRVARIFYPFDPSIDVAKDAAISSIDAFR